MHQTPVSNSVAWKLELCQSVRKMRRPGEVVFLLALFLLLGTLHGTRGQYDDYDDYKYEDLHEDFVPDEYVDEYEEEAVD